MYDRSGLGIGIQLLNTNIKIIKVGDYYCNNDVSTFSNDWKKMTQNYFVKN